MLDDFHSKICKEIIKHLHQPDRIEVVRYLKNKPEKITKIFDDLKILPCVKVFKFGSTRKLPAQIAFEYVSI